MNQRNICFGGCCLRLIYSSGRIAELVDFLFKDIPDKPSLPLATVLRLEDSDQDGGLKLWQDDIELFMEATLEGMAVQILSQVCFLLAYWSQGGLLLHSAAVRAGQAGLILPGKSGSGKSTLTAWLVKQGCLYSSDEMVFIANGSEMFNGFTRPLTLKAPARSLITPSFSNSRHSSNILSSDNVDLIDPASLGAEVGPSDIVTNLIVFPRYQANANTKLVLSSKANSAFELVKCLANARNLSNHGLSEVIRIAHVIPAYILHYGEGESASHVILELIKDRILDEGI